MSRTRLISRAERWLFGGLLAVGLASVMADPARSCLADGGDSGPAVATGHDVKPARTSSTAISRHPLDAVLESDNWTFRPTVLIRRGTSQGSGTIIASVDDETLILTAGHVIRARGPITVELHRYNVGIERHPAVPGLWPRHVAAETVVTDTQSDLAIIRLRNLVTLPYVARLGREDQEVVPNARLTSVGIDLGTRLSSWKTELVEVRLFELNDSGTDRPFLVTARIPEHGRSGGGLFDVNGMLVGVCVGHAELDGRRRGVFSSVENVRQLLREHGLASTVARSEAKHVSLARRVLDLNPQRQPRQTHTTVTPTQALHELAPSGP